MVLVAKAKRPVSIHQKKRTGQHHQTASKHFAKTYWPYLPMLLIVVVGLVINITWSRNSRAVLGDSSAITSRTLLAETNGARTADHESALNLNLQLNQAAQAKASDMAAHNYWSHNAPDGTTPWTFMNQAGYKFALAGENLAYGFGSSDAVTAAWLGSTEHRANILDARYKDVGFGVITAANFQGHGTQTIVVAMYAEPAGAQTAAIPQAYNAHGIGSSDTSVPAGGASAQSQSEPASQQITRMQTMNSRLGSWTAAAALIIVAGVLVLASRHAKAWRRAIIRGERFAIKHPGFDVAVFALVVVAIVLTRSAGSIR